MAACGSRSGSAASIEGAGGGQAGQLDGSSITRAAWASRNSPVKWPSCSASLRPPRDLDDIAGCQVGRDLREMPPATKPAWRPCRRVSSVATSPVSPCGRLDSTMP